MNTRPFALAGLAAIVSISAQAQHRSDLDNDGRSSIRHVLLISVDGMHAVDFRNCRLGWRA